VDPDIRRRFVEATTENLAGGIGKHLQSQDYRLYISGVSQQWDARAENTKGCLRSRLRRRLTNGHHQNQGKEKPLGGTGP
jgi:hypothetical protein